MRGGALFITGDNPLVRNRGDVIYSFQILQCLRRLHGRVVVLCGAAFGDSAEGNVEYREYPVGAVAFRDKVLSGLPHAALRQVSREGRRLLDELLRERPAVVYVDHIRSVWALPALRALRRAGWAGGVVYITHNEELGTRLSIMRDLGGRPLHLLMHGVDALRARRADAAMISLAGAMTCITGKDAERYGELYRLPKVEVVPPLYEGRVAEREITAAVPRKVCLLGNYEWYAKKRNLETFLDAGHRRLTEAGIGIRVAGRMEPSYGEAIARRYEGVEVLGNVPDVPECLRDCRIGLAVERVGGGFKLKLLDYVFNGLAVFMLDDLALEIDLVDGRSAAIYGNNRELAEGVATRIDDLAMLDEMRRHAISDNARFLDGDRMFRSFEGIVAALTGPR